MYRSVLAGVVALGLAGCMTGKQQTQVFADISMGVQVLQSANDIVNAYCPVLAGIATEAGSILPAKQVKAYNQVVATGNIACGIAASAHDPVSLALSIISAIAQAKQVGLTTVTPPVLAK